MLQGHGALGRENLGNALAAFVVAEGMQRLVETGWGWGLGSLLLLLLHIE